MMLTHPAIIDLVATAAPDIVKDCSAENNPPVESPQNMDWDNAANEPVKPCIS